ncbi:MAG: DivIVA domain-containing protein [Bacteroidetes bacterium]|nr:DivIVA domain-containing protein [Bacteroidota bacterium]
MKFSPFSIKNQEFGKALRGYDKDEVRAYLEKLSDEFEIIQNQNTSLSEELDKLRGQVQEYRKIEKSLQSTLLSAQESSSKSVESAKKQTALMIREAELKSTQIVERAKDQADFIRDSVLKLREEKNLLMARLKAMINSQASILELNVEEVSEPVQVYKENKPDRSNDINVDDILEKLL